MGPEGTAGDQSPGNDSVAPEAQEALFQGEQIVRYNPDADNMVQFAREYNLDTAPDATIDLDTHDHTEDSDTSRIIVATADGTMVAFEGNEAFDVTPYDDDRSPERITDNAWAAFPRQVRMGEPFGPMPAAVVGVLIAGARVPAENVETATEEASYKFGGEDPFAAIKDRLRGSELIPSDFSTWEEVDGEFADDTSASGTGAQPKQKSSRVGGTGMPAGKPAPGLPKAPAEKPMHKNDWHYRQYRPHPTQEGEVEVQVSQVYNTAGDAMDWEANTRSSQAGRRMILSTVNPNESYFVRDFDVFRVITDDYGRPTIERVHKTASIYVDELRVITDDYGRPTFERVHKTGSTYIDDEKQGRSLAKARIGQGWKLSEDIETPAITEVEILHSTRDKIQSANVYEPVNEYSPFTTLESLVEEFMEDEKMQLEHTVQMSTSAQSRQPADPFEHRPPQARFGQYEPAFTPPPIERQPEPPRRVAPPAPSYANPEWWEKRETNDTTVPSARPAVGGLEKLLPRRGRRNSRR